MHVIIIYFTWGNVKIYLPKKLTYRYLNNTVHLGIHHPFELKLGYLISHIHKNILLSAVSESTNHVKEPDGSKLPFNKRELLTILLLYYFLPEMNP